METPLQPSKAQATWACLELPITDYRRVMQLQKDLAWARARNILSQDLVLILQHPPVFTLGNRGGTEHLHVDNDYLKNRGIDLVKTGRGGSITYHGPGQLVIYPIVDLAVHRWPVAKFVEALEAVMIHIAEQWGVVAKRSENRRGVWVQARKLGSVGLRLHQKVSFHGLALNVDLDLTPFDWITPCGLEGIAMTSLRRESAGPARPDLAAVQEAAKTQIQQVFSIQLEPLSEACLTDYLGDAHRVTASC